LIWQGGPAGPTWEGCAAAQPYRWRAAGERGRGEAPL